MNTSKRKQKAIRLGIAAVLALVLLVSVSVVLVIANTPDEVQADAMTVTLDGKVNLIFKFNGGKVNTDTVSYTAEVGGRTEKITGLQSVKVGDKTVVTVPLMPYEMTEEVKLYQVDKNGNNLAVSTGSVRDYADKVLANSTYAEHHNAMRALLNYGAMTQIDANANTSNLANADVFVRNNPIDIIKAVPFGALDEKTGDKEFFKDRASVNLVFKGGDIALRYTVKGVDSAPTATFKYGEETVYGTFIKKDDAFTFDISNVGVNNFDTVWDVTITSDGKTVTSHHSVLEYLNYLVTSTDNKITAEEKDVARSLYQLYQNTQENKLETNCAHKNSGYYIPADVNSSYHMCAACGKKINADPIDNKVTAYFSGEHLSGIKAIGGVDATYSEKNGYRITWNEAASRLELIWLREARYASKSLTPADGKWGDVPFEIGNAKYIVIKYKVNEGSGITGVRVHLGSTKWTAEDTLSTGEEGQYSVYSYKDSLRNGDTDCTAILSLNDFGDKVAADENGNRVIDGLKLEIVGSAAVKDTLTIDSIEFVTHLGECVNANGDNLCDDCGKELPTSAYKYLTANNLVGPSSIDYARVNCTATVADGNLKITSNDSTSEIQYLWLRENYYATQTNFNNGTLGGQIKGMGADTTIDAGSANYIVVKVKSSVAITPIFRLSTTAYNYDKQTDTKQFGQAAISAYIPFQITGAGKWSVFAIDLDTYGERVAKLDGKRVFDTFILTGLKGLNSTDSFEIQYIAFADDMDEVKALAGTDKVVYVQKQQ